MMGFFVIHPKHEVKTIHRDFAIFLHEWDVPPGSATPNPATMTDFNLFTFNARVYPGTAPLVVQKGDRVRIRLANLSMDSHPIHIHGVRFFETGTESGSIPLSAQIQKATVNVPPGATRDIEFVADEEGDWAMHCHKSHHTMNHMAHDVPNMLGVQQAEVEPKCKNYCPTTWPWGRLAWVTWRTCTWKGPSNTVPMMTGDGPFGGIDMAACYRHQSAQARAGQCRSGVVSRAPQQTATKSARLRRRSHGAQTRRQLT